MDCRELVKHAQAIGDVLWNLFNSALWQTFNQARPQCFRYSQDAQSARQFFCDWLPSCCKIHTLSTTFTACSVRFSTCLFAAIAYFPVAASPGPVFVRPQQRR
jgi:hypothetical protein